MTSDRTVLLRNFGTTIERLRTRRGMYIADGFDALVAFLVGYSEATKHGSGVDLMSAVQDFVKASHGREFALIWPHFLLWEMADGDEAEATRLVFSCLDAFVSQGESGLEASI